MNSILQNQGYILNSDINVWAKSGYSSINYSDGDATENSIANAISKASDLSVLSPELMKNCIDWPSTYHLSSNRANLLRPIEQLFGVNRDVLEIGAGCGAITRYLGECGANVLALEGTLRRASMARSRTRDLANVSVLAEQFSDFKMDKKFDVITLIGVLEYSNLYVNDSNPVDAVLKKVQEFLKPDGVLVIAIENQLGLKYFAGSPEDHVGVPMYGIEDRYSNSSVITFGRPELSSKISLAGMPFQSWWYPFPDYKLPTALVSDYVLKTPSNAKKINSLIASTFEIDPQMPRTPFFAIDRVWGTLSRNGLAPDFANSFLIISGRSKESIKSINNEVAYHYSTLRLPQFAKKITFNLSLNEGVDLREDLLLQNNTNLSNGPLHLKIDKCRRYINGVVWADELKQRLFRNDWTLDTIVEWAALWSDELIKISGLSRHSLGSKVNISGKFIDAIPQNLIYGEDGGFQFIDLEWEHDGELEFGYVLYRGILASLSKLGSIVPPDVGIEVNLRKLTCNVLWKLDLGISEIDVSRYDGMEREFQRLVTGIVKDGSIQDGKLFQESLRLGLPKNAWPEVMDNLLAISQLQAALKSHQDLIKNIYSTFSWRVTKPVRAIKRLLRR